MLNWYGVVNNTEVLDFFRDHGWSMTWAVYLPSYTEDQIQEQLLYIKQVLDHGVPVYFILAPHDGTGGDNRPDFLGIENAYQLSEQYELTKEALQNASLWGHPYIAGFTVDSEAPMDWLDSIVPYIEQANFPEAYRLAMTTSSTLEDFANASISIDDFLDLVHADGYNVTCWSNAYASLDSLDGDFDFSLIMHDATLSSDEWDEVSLMAYRGYLNPAEMFGIPLDVNLLFASRYYVYDYGVRMQSFPVKESSTTSMFIGGMGGYPFDDINQIIDEIGICRALDYDNVWLFALGYFLNSTYGGGGDFGIEHLQLIADSLTNTDPIVITENPINTRIDTFIKLTFMFIDVYRRLLIPLF